MKIVIALVVVVICASIFMISMGSKNENIEINKFILDNKELYPSTVSKILDLVENATINKSKAENFITKFKGASYSSWNTLNLSNFTYGSARSDLSYNRTYSEDAYFVNNYAQTSANEDRASTFEYMMFTNKASCLNANKPVWKKAKFMSQLLEKYLESVKPEVTEYWERHL